MKRYAEMTTDEKAIIFPGGCPTYHVYWVLCEGERVGYVCQTTRNGAGKAWWAAGHSQAWYACDTLGNQMARNGDGGWLFPSKSKASEALLALHEGILR